MEEEATRISRGGHVGSFSAMCSPPLSLMFKGKLNKSNSKSSLLKSKKMELTDELDDEICDALCKISKSSEELWREVSSIFSPPTPIGSKGGSDFSLPLDAYKNASQAPGSTTPRGSSSSTENNEAASGKTANQSAPPTFFPPSYPATSNKLGNNTAGTTVTNSISLPSAKSEPAEVKTEKKVSIELRDKHDARSITPLKRSKRNARGEHVNHSSPSVAKKHSSLLQGNNADGSYNAANIHNIINTTSLSDSDSSTNGDMQEDALDHNHNQNNSSHTPNLQPFAHHSGSSFPGLFNNSNASNNHSHNHFNTNNSNSQNHSNISHSDSSLYFNSSLAGGNVYNNNNGNNFSDSNNHNNANNSLSLNLGINTSGFSANDKHWTEVIFCCKKLVALAGSALAGPLSFPELVEALSLSRHVMTSTVSVLNSGAYPPVPAAPLADEFNRLVGETFGHNFNPNMHNLTSTPSTPTTPSSNPHSSTNLINLNANANNHTYPFFTQNPPNYSHTPTSPPTASPFASSNPTSPSSTVSSPLALSSSSSSGSWGGRSTFAFEELRNRLPSVPVNVREEEDEDEEEDSDDDSSAAASPPPLSPLSTLNVVPLSPCLSPGSSSPNEKAVVVKEGKEVKEREPKESNWKKPRGKKRPKYEADLMCLSCGVRQTPEWRRGPAGAKTLCNACGLHWAKVLKAEGKGDQKRAALLEAKRSQFMLAAQKRSAGVSRSKFDKHK